MEVRGYSTIAKLHQNHLRTFWKNLELAQLNSRWRWGGGYSTIAKLHQNNFEDILEKCGNLVELAQLNSGWRWGGGVTQPSQNCTKIILRTFWKYLKIWLSWPNSTAGVGWGYPNHHETSPELFSGHLNKIENLVELAQLNCGWGWGCNSTIAKLYQNYFRTF